MLTVLFDTKKLDYTLELQMCPYLIKNKQSKMIWNIINMNEWFINKSYKYYTQLDLVGTFP